MIEARFQQFPDNRLERLADFIPEAEKEGHKAVGEMGAGVLKIRIRRVYERTILYGPSGRPLWKRSGDLRASPQKPKVTRNQMLIEFAGRPAEPIRNWPGGYAWRRSKLGVLWHPNAPAGTRRRPDRGLVRKNDYIGDTQRIVKTHGPAVFEERFGRAIDGK